MSFSQEMKDFVAGWTAVRESGQKDRQLDLQKQELEDLKKYRTDTTDIQREELNLKRDAQNKRFALAEKASKRADAASEASIYNNIYNGLAGYDGVTPDTMNYAPEADTTDYSVPSEDDGSDGYARGGLVRHYDEGGAVDPMGNYTGGEARVMMPTAPKPASAIPTQPPAAPVTSLESHAPRAEPKEPSRKSNIIIDSSLKAMQAAAPALVADAKAARTGTGNPETDITRNKGGLSPQEWQEAVKAIDPNGEIPSHMRGAAVLGTTYRYFMEHGQPAKAQRIAKAILVADKQMTQTLGALALRAMQNGNQDAALKLMGDALNRFPTDHEIKLTKAPNGGVGYTVTSGGKVVDQGAVNTQQFWQLATKVQDGSMYIEQMGRIAGQGGGKPRMGYAEALQGVTDAGAKVRAAQQAYQDIKDGIQEGDEAAALAAWRQADAEGRAARKQALEIGRSSYNGKTSTSKFDADLMASIQRAYESKATAVPEDPNAPAQAQAPAPAAPSAGDVVDGWRFLGGDPGNPKNWEQAK